MASVAHYLGDAIVMQLPLLGGDSVIHDWNYLLSATHTLKYTAAISSTMYGIALLIIGTGLVMALVSALQKSPAQLEAMRGEKY